MTGRPTGLMAELPPLPPAPDPVASPRDVLATHYGSEMLTAFRELHVVTGELTAHLERGGDPAAFMSKAVEFDGLVRATGAAMLALGHLFTSDGTA